jgi:pyrroline-5-carboxylate reductase
MPNTPVEVRRGVVCYATADVDGGLERKVVGLFERLGEVLRIPERLMDAATAVTGVGPAYQALLVEAQVEAALRYGLDSGLAARLVVETMLGTATLLAARNYDTVAVRHEVTSPGGGTARGLAALERAGLRAAFQDAIDAVMAWSRG